MAWVDAVRKYAEMKGTKWHIPKKGSDAYNEIKAIQSGGKSEVKEEKVEVKKGMYVAEKGGVKFRPEGKKNMKVVLKPEAEKITVKKQRKVRSDKGVKRVKKEVVVEKSKTGRKVRSDKGKKRGTRVGNKALERMPVD